MQSTVQLFNTALARLGGEQLDRRISPQEDDTLGALCENLFPHVLDLTLGAHAWGFAQRRASLALVQALDDDAAYPYAYALPSDCVRALRLEGFGGLNRSPAYIIEGDTLRATVSGACLIYVRRITDPRRWPAAFADALAWAMAAELASAKLNDSGKQQWARQNYELTLERAIARDCAAQNRLRPVSAWQAARFGTARPLPERF
ncbi:MAG: hypothetical protein K2J64_04125 [Desulfovibrio sp.]|nr:hypothetical protein [Desulfovibrio sp.]